MDDVRALNGEVFNDFVTPVPNALLIKSVAMGEGCPQLFKIA